MVENILSEHFFVPLPFNQRWIRVKGPMLLRNPWLVRGNFGFEEACVAYACHNLE